MSLILTRSPYFVSRGNLDNDATLTLEIGEFIDGDTFEIAKTYNLVFRNSYLIDISPFIADYLENTYTWRDAGTFSLAGYSLNLSADFQYVRTIVSGSRNGVPQSDVIDEHYASKGYLYSTDDYNKDFSEELKAKCYYAGASNVVYKLDDSALEIPLVNTTYNLIAGSPFDSEVVTIQYIKNNKVVNQRNYVFDNEFSYYGGIIVSSNNNVRFVGGQNISFKERVEADGGTYVETKCLEDFLDKFTLEDYDSIVLSNKTGDVHKIKVKTIEECKHKPYIVTFVNRFGIYENLWFFKRSDLSMSVTKESYRGNSIGSYESGNGIKTINHFNVNGKERITLNSGFVEEEMNEAFKQLLLSEEVTLYDYRENKRYNVNLGTSEIQYKQHINDKLINYAIEFEFAHEVINNVG